MNPQDDNPSRIKKSDKEFVEKLNYEGVEFPVSQKHYNKIEKQNAIRINVFGYEDKQTYPIYVSEEKFGNQMNLLLITEDKSKHYVLIKNFNRFMYSYSKHKKENIFACIACSASVLKKY